MASLMTRLRSRLGSSGLAARAASARGAELVEFAMILPILLVVVAGIIDFGFLFRNYEIVTNAAREGARMRSAAGYTDADAITRAGAYMTASGLTATSVSVTPTNVTPGGGGPVFTTYTVVVTYNHPMTLLRPFMALLGGTVGSSLQLTGTAVMRSEIAAAGS